MNDFLIRKGIVLEGRTWPTGDRFKGAVYVNQLLAFRIHQPENLLDVIRHLPEELFDVLQRGFRAFLSCVIAENQDMAARHVVGGGRVLDKHGMFVLGEKSRFATLVAGREK